MSADRPPPSDFAEIPLLPETTLLDEELGGAIIPLLLSISKSSRAYLAILLAQADVHPGQDQLLVQLKPENRVSVSALADQLAVRPSTVSKMLDRLIEKDLVQRISSEGDARRTLVLLTANGEKVRRSVLLLWQGLERDLRRSLDQDDHQRLVGSLTQLEGLLAAKLRRLR